MTIEEFRNLANEAFNFYDSSLTGEEIEEALQLARGIGYSRTMIKGTGLGGFEPAVPGEDYDYVLLKGSGAPDMYTEAAIGQHYLNTAATENPYEYVCVAYSRENGYQWRPLSGVSEFDPKAQGSFRLNPVVNEDKGWFSIAMGINCVAEGDYSHATGYSARAAGKQAHAEGYYTNAVGDSSHAEGERALAQGEAAHAEGTDTAAYGANAHAEGLGTQAGSENQHVQGKYNVRDNNNKYAHIVGNGTENERSNAHTLDWNGNAWFKGKVFIGGTGADDPEAVELGTGGGSGGGSGADLLNDNGVIKQEHLPEGYPYSEMGIGTILPETSYAIDAEAGMGFVHAPIILTLGEEYTVNWNGVDYVCTALDASFMEENTATLGNVGALTGGDDTGEPFVLLASNGIVSEGETINSFIVVALDGTTTGTLSLSGLTEIATPIASKYIPTSASVLNAYASAFESIPVGGDYSRGYRCVMKDNVDFATLHSAASAGVHVVLHVDVFPNTDADTVTLPLVSRGDQSTGKTMVFANTYIELAWNDPTKGPAFQLNGYKVVWSEDGIASFTHHLFTAYCTEINAGY